MLPLHDITADHWPKISGSSDYHKIINFSLSRTSVSPTPSQDPVPFSKPWFELHMILILGQGVLCSSGLSSVVSAGNFIVRMVGLSASLVALLSIHKRSVYARACVCVCYVIYILLSLSAWVSLSRCAWVSLSHSLFLLFPLPTNSVHSAGYAEVGSTTRMG